LINFDEVVQAIKNDDTYGPREIRAVEFSKHSFKEQVEIAHSTDVLVMVHGGALVHSTWLPYGAMVMDIYPYGFWISKHSGIVHWMRNNLQDLYLGHHPMAVSSSAYHTQTNGMSFPDDCICTDNFDCGVAIFGSLLRLDIPTFLSELNKAIESWRQQSYGAPMAQLEFIEWSDSMGVKIERDGESENAGRTAKGLSPRPKCV
jgi:hypothetical protein